MPDATRKPKAVIACTHLTLLDGIRRSLAIDHDVVLVENGWGALDKIMEGGIALALLDVNLPGLSGYDVVKRVQREKKSGAVGMPSAILVAQKDRAKADVYVAKGWADGALVFPLSDGDALTEIYAAADRREEANWEQLNPVQRGLLQVTRHSVAKLAEMAQGKVPVDPEIMHSCSASIVEAASGNDLTTVLEMLKGHHNYTFVHALKVAAYMTLFGGAIGVSRSDMETLAQAGLMHDVGKALTPVSLLNKPGRLEGKEWDVMRQHALLSGEVLREKMAVGETLILVAERHHERLDGTGYPYGLKGAEIDDCSLICSIADVYSALTDKRAYKPSMGRDQALSIMDEMAGSHLEPTFYRRFREVMGDQLVEVA